MKRGRAGVLVVVIGLTVFLLDQIIKSWVRTNIPLYGAIYPVPTLAPVFRITHLTNTGVAFGFLQNSRLLYLLIVAVIVVTATLYVRYLPWEKTLVQVAVGLQLGGAIGNLYDRLIQGHVTDFLDFFISKNGITYHYPPFNIADSAIVVGVILLVVSMWSYEREQAHHHSLFSTEHVEDRL